MKDSKVIKLRETSADRSLVAMAELSLDEVVICGIKGEDIYFCNSKIRSYVQVLGMLERIKFYTLTGE